VAITNLNGVVAGLQPPTQDRGSRSYVTQIGNRPVDLWYAAGGQTDVVGLNGSILSSTSAVVPGQFPHFDPPGGINAYLARLEATDTAVVATVLLCDRLWQNSGITITSSSLQSITSPTWPARDNNGATSGDGVLVGLSVSATCGTGSPTATLSYTNSAGTASRTSTLAEVANASSAVGAFYRFGLQAGDAGIQSVQGLTFGSTWASGTCNLVAYRVLAVLEVPNTGYPCAIDAVNGGFPQLFNGVVPFPIAINVSNLASALFMVYQETQG